MAKIAYYSLEGLASATHLPQAYLKKLAAQNKIPFLDVNGRLRFDLELVKQALDELARKGVSDEE